jgi:hypothetical protein
VNLDADQKVFWRGSVSDFATDVRALLTPEQQLALGAHFAGASHFVVPMLLHCPDCGTRHIDEPPFDVRPHRLHACQHCGMLWQPALVPTVGVQFLPGMKNPSPAVPAPAYPVQCGNDRPSSEVP